MRPAVTERKNAGSYGEYLKIPQLLALQSTLSDPPQHDETLFIIVHQVFELWFKQILHEIDAVVGCMLRGRTREATRLCRRIIEIQRILIQQIRVLETMTPPDFLQFRGLLNPASGFQSHQFRALEFRSGLKDRSFVELHRSSADVVKALQQAFDAPSLPEAWARHVRVYGLDYPDTAVDTTPAESERLAQRRLDALARIYLEHESFYDLYLLAEALIEFDENFGLWRQHHVAMVERMIGMKRGTGGSEGVEYLRTTLAKRCFPELWAVRTMLVRP
jgi:tryptophan 2,3-dioxygenase